MKALLFLLLCLPAAAEEGSPLVGTVVRSREYVVRRAPRKQEEFIGDVRYRRATRSFRADWALFDHLSQFWRLRGAIRGEEHYDDGGLLGLEGQEAVHDLRTGLGSMRGKDETDPVVVTRGGPLRVSLPTPLEGDRAVGRVLVWDEKSRTARLSGSVRVEGLYGDAAAEEALYRHEDRTLTLSGGPPYVAPREKGWSAAAQADLIRATSEPRRLRAEGGVHGWIHFPKESVDAVHGRGFPRSRRRP
ncbi:MAG: hypothetical protein WC969_04015 [Elusimicrobiota bacterium]